MEMITHKAMKHQKIMDMEQLMMLHKDNMVVVKVVHMVVHRVDLVVLLMVLLVHHIQLAMIIHRKCIVKDPKLNTVSVH